MVAWSQLFDDDDELCDVLERTFGAATSKVVAAAVSKRRVAMLMHKKGGQGPQGKKQHVLPFSWDAHVLRLTEQEFKRRYRLPWPSFNKLLHKLSADLDVVHPKQAKNSREGTVVPNAVKLAIGLRYLAGGDPLDLFLIYNVSLSYVYKCIWAVVEAVNRHLAIEFPIDDPAKLAQLEAEFRAQSAGGVWQGQVGAIDGVHFATAAPSNHDVDDPMRYHVARKDEYALLCTMKPIDGEGVMLAFSFPRLPHDHGPLQTSHGSRLPKAGHNCLAPQPPLHQLRLQLVPPPAAAASSIAVAAPKA